MRISSDNRTKTHTMGIFVCKGHIFHTIERPWLNNQRNVSCIPSGTYEVYFFAEERKREIQERLAHSEGTESLGDSDAQRESGITYERGASY